MQSRKDAVLWAWLAHNKVSRTFQGSCTIQCWYGQARPGWCSVQLQLQRSALQAGLLGPCLSPAFPPVALAPSAPGPHLACPCAAVLCCAVQVSGRLARTERENPSEADPAFPHVIWPTAQQCPACRKSPLLTNGDIPDWDLDAVYAFLIEYYTGEKLRAGEGEGGQQPGLRGLLAQRTKRASWLEAIFVCGVVGGVVYMVLKGSTQYRLRKSESRLL